MDVVVATHSREVRTALFIALNAVATVTIKATATSTAELTNYCHAFQPDIVIAESGLPGSHMSLFLQEFERLEAPAQIFVVGGDDPGVTADIGKASVLRDVDHLLETISAIQEPTDSE